MPTTATIQTVALSICGFLAAAVITALISANVRRWANEKGHDRYLLTVWNMLPEWGHKLLAGWNPLRQLWWMWLCLGLSGGLGGALWLIPQPPGIVPERAKDAADAGTRQSAEAQTRISSLESLAPSSLAPQSSEQAPINWQPDFQINWYSGPQMAWIRFVGKSTILARIKDAYIISKLTGHREPLQIANATNFNERWNVNQIEPIPPGATTMLVYEPKPPPSIPDFLNQWGAFEFHVVYEGGEYAKIYSQDCVRDKFASDLPGIYGPHVAPRTTNEIH
jgi:hypothetical protein